MKPEKDETEREDSEGLLSLWEGELAARSEDGFFAAEEAGEDADRVG
jgi:hypothetical protein